MRIETGGASSSPLKALASTRETRRRNTSPVAMPRTPPLGLRRAVRRDRTMASSATCGAYAREATFTAKVNDSSAAASQRWRQTGLQPSRAWKCAALPPPGVPKEDLLERSLLQNFGGERAQRVCRSPCRVPRHASKRPWRPCSIRRMRTARPSAPV